MTSVFTIFRFLTNSWVSNLLLCSIFSIQSIFVSPLSIIFAFSFYFYLWILFDDSSNFSLNFYWLILNRSQRMFFLSMATFFILLVDGLLSKSTFLWLIGNNYTDGIFLCLIIKLLETLFTILECSLLFLERSPNWNWLKLNVCWLCDFYFFTFESAITLNCERFSSCADCKWESLFF